MKKQLMSNIDADGQNAKKSTPPGIGYWLGSLIYSLDNYFIYR